MQEEISALNDNDTYSLTALPEGRKCINSRWVYSIKPGISNEPKFKARYVAKGYSQVPHVDYDSTFAPTARICSVRLMAQIAAKFDMCIHQMDVKSAYLHAIIDRDIYVKQPVGFEKFSDDGHPLVCKLKKSLYGLKQSSRNWNELLDSFFKSLDFKQSLSDPCLYTKVDGKVILILLIWVDDILICSNDDAQLCNVKRSLSERFRMKDLGLLNWFLGIEFNFGQNCIEMSQKNFVLRLLDKFQLNDCNPKTLPCDVSCNKLDFGDSPLLDNPRLFREVVGSLIYVMVCTRPDIAFIVSKLSQYMTKPTKAHLSVAKNVLKYLKGTIYHKLIYRKCSEDLYLTGFSDSDWAGSEDHRSTSGYAFKLSRDSALVSWKTKKQSTVALSSTEAEYQAVTYAIQEGKFLRQLFADIMNADLSSFDLFIDNQGAINLCKNPIHQQRSKHIDVKYHFIRSEVRAGNVIPRYIPTNENIADLFTKPCSKVKLSSLNINGV